MTRQPASLSATLAAIDAANAVDPDHSEGGPAARLYGERMKAELERIAAAGIFVDMIVQSFGREGHAK